MEKKRWLLLAAVCLMVAAAAAVFHPSLVDRVRASFGAEEAASAPRTREEHEAYLEDHFQNYDSYLIGGPMAEAIPLSRLNHYLDASFYAITWLGGGLEEERELISRLLEQYGAKHIVLALDLTVAEEETQDGTSVTYSRIQDTARFLAGIRTLCDAAGAELLVIWQPLSATQMNNYQWPVVENLLFSASRATDSWCFLDYGDIQCDAGNYHADGHYRETVGEMMLARIFGDETVSVPDGFGDYLPMETETPRTRNVAEVPILMYHAFTQDPTSVFSSTILSAETFESQLCALRDADYESVRFSDLIDFVYDGKPLPEKPVVLVADDGYLDNLTLAAPLLEEYGFCMSVAVIGCSVGKNTYKDTGAAMRPHFSLEDAQPWVDAGILEIVSHSYDLHQIAGLDGIQCRRGMYPLAGETPEAYATALTADLTRSREQLEQGLGVEIEALAYPHGYFTEISEQVAEELGFKVTMTIEPGSNKLIRGMPQSLFQLHRNWITDDLSGQELIALLDSLQ